MKSSRFCALVLAAILLAVGCKKIPPETITPLYEAVLTGDIDLVRTLIARGADVNARDWRGDTPLHRAAEGGHKEVVEHLIGKGAVVDATNVHAQTALHMAAMWKHRSVVELLIANDAGASDTPGDHWGVEGLVE